MKAYKRAVSSKRTTKPNKTTNKATSKATTAANVNKSTGKSTRTTKSSDSRTPYTEGIEVPTDTPLVLKMKTKARNQHQQDYLDIIEQNDMTFGLGPAGTGKTFLGVAKAAEYLVKNRVKRIVLVRPAVEAGERIGFLPGSMQDKVDPYMIPLYDALDELLGTEKVKALIASKVIEIAPLAFMRGRTLKDAFIIMDEAQNTTYEQLKMFLTRFGNNSKVVITGDSSQVDLPGNNRSGLPIFTNLLKDTEGIGMHTFDSQDIVRHPLVTKIVNSCDHYEAYDR